MSTPRLTLAKLATPILLFLFLFLGQPCQAQWSWDLNNDGNDIWLQSNLNGQAMFDYRIGAGGAVGDMRDNLNGNRPLLGPSYIGEPTDRIIQWTAWAQNIQNDILNPGYQYYDRFNLTQGGTASGLISPTVKVFTDSGRGIVDVYSVPQDQWMTEQQPHIQSAFSALTRYEMQDHGVLKVRRVIRVGDVSVDGNTDEFDRLYVEAWTPFRQMGVFDAMTRKVDTNGNPDPASSNQAGVGFPYYPRWKVDETEGYAAVYKQADHENETAVGVVFGTKQIEHAGFDETNPNNDYFALNSMDWNNGPNDQGIAVLPGIYFERNNLDNPVLSGSIIDQTLYFAPRHGLDGELASLMADLVDDVPAPVLYSSDYAFTGELAGIVGQLNENLSLSGSRTDHLGGMAVSVPEPSAFVLLAMASMALTTVRRRRRS